MPTLRFLSHRNRFWSGSLMNFWRRRSLRRIRCRFFRRSRSCRGAECKPCRCPGRRSHGRGDGGRSPIRRSTTDRAIRRTSLHTIHRTSRYSTKDPSTKGRTTRCSTTGRPIPRNIHSTKGHSATASTIRRSTKDWPPNRWRCRKAGTMSTMMWRTKAGRPPRRRTRCRKDRRTLCCPCC